MSKTCSAGGSAEFFPFSRDETIMILIKIKGVIYWQHLVRLCAGHWGDVSVLGVSGWSRGH